MGLFDMFSKRGKNTSDGSSMVELGNNHNIVDPHSIENGIANRMNSVRLEDCIRGTMAALSAGFAQMIPSLRTVAQTITVDGMGYTVQRRGGFSDYKRIERESTSLWRACQKYHIRKTLP